MPKYAKTRVVADATNHQVGQDEVVTMDTTGPAKLVHEAVEKVDRPMPKGFYDALAQGEEILTITLHTTTDKNAEPAPAFWNNGKRYFFPRGFPQKVPRKVVEQIARCKETAYRNEEYTESDGSLAVRWPSTTSLRYPFSVNEDPNPKCGPAWLAAILAER